jgi:hypothetical protein
LAYAEDEEPGVKRKDVKREIQARRRGSGTVAPGWFPPGQNLER